MQLPDLKFTPMKGWPEPRCEGKRQPIWSGVVPVCAELEDGLLWICFPLGIRAGTGLASVQRGIN